MKENQEEKLTLYSKVSQNQPHRRTFYKDDMDRNVASTI